MADYTLYITHSKRAVERLEFDKYLECVHAVSDAYLEDPHVMGYICASDGTPWTVIYWNKGRQTRNFNPVNLPNSVKALRLIGL